MEFFFIILIVATIVIAAKSKNKKNKATIWREAAQQLGLTYSSGFAGQHMLHGRRYDQFVSVKAMLPTPGSAGKAQIEYEITTNRPRPFKFRISSRSNHFDSSNRLSEQVDVKTGDSRFDNCFVVESAQVDAVIDFLGENDRNVLRKLEERFDFFSANELGLKASRNSNLDQSALQRDINRLAEAALSIYSADRPSKPSPPPLPEKQPSASQQTVTLPLESSEPTPFENDDVTEAAQPAEALELEDLSRPLNSSVEPQSDPKLKTAEPAIPTSDDEGTTAENRLLETFADVTGRYDFVQTFEKQLKNESSEVALTLSSAEKYSMDRHFGRGPGIRATFEVGETESGDPIKLVAGYPGLDRLRELQSLLHHEVTVEGEFVACDAFEKTIFLQVASEPKAADHPDTTSIVSA